MLESVLPANKPANGALLWRGEPGRDRRLAERYPAFRVKLECCKVRGVGVPQYQSLLVLQVVTEAITALSRFMQ